MKYRRLFSGERVPIEGNDVDITISSCCPRKWAFVDMETGDIWVHRSRSRKNKNSSRILFAADEKAINCITDILFDERYAGEEDRPGTLG